VAKQAVADPGSAERLTAAHLPEEGEGAAPVPWQLTSAWEAKDGSDTIPELFNMAEYLVDRHVAAGRGGQAAIHYQGGVLTYADLLERVNRTANVLSWSGLEMEDRCLLILPDSPRFIATFLGAMKLGAVPVPVNTLASTQELLYYFNDSRADVAVVSPEIWPRLEPIVSELRHVRRFLMAGQQVASGCGSLDRLTAEASTVCNAAPVSRDDASFWLYTSGTTGRPKGVIHLHHDMLHCVGPYGREVLRASPDDVFFSASKLSFSYGLVNSLYIPLLNGARVLLNPDKPTPATVFGLIERHRPSVFFAVPTTYATLLADDGAHDLSSLRLCVSAGEPLPETLYERWRSRYGMEILDGVGSSEFGYIYISSRPGQVKPGSCGTLIPPHRARVLGEDGQPVPAGRVGELYVSSDSVAAGYWNKHDQTMRTFAGSWLRTRDLFMVDEDGYFFYQGRADDAIKVSGLYVAAAEVEGALLTHGAVAECAVVGAPDADGLLKPKAFVVLRVGEAGCPALTAKLQAHVKDRLAHYKCPRWVEFVPELPKTATGKVQRHRLRNGA